MLLQWQLIPRVYKHAAYTHDSISYPANTRDGSGVLELWEMDPLDDFVIDCTYPASPGAALPSGLGLIYVGGYLTQKGASLLNCPSLTNDAVDGPPWPFADNDWYGTWTTGEQFRERWNFIRLPKLDSVFYTTAGKVLWSDNGQNFGFNDTNTYFGDWSYWCVTNYGDVRVVGPSWGTTDCGYNNGNPQPCVLTGSYMMRPDRTTGSTWNSYKLDKMIGKALVSDAIWGWMWRTSERQTPWLSVPWNTRDMLTTRHWTSNHDLSYNVLMGDGAVKTFSDAGTSLMEDIRKEQLRRNGYTPTNNDYAGWWKIYFDPLYAQD